MNYLTDITVYVKTFIKSWRFGSILVDPEMKIFNLILAPLIFHQSHFKCKVVSLSISKVPSALVLITELIPKDFKEQGHLPMCHLFNMDDMYGNTSLAWQKDILTLWFCVSLMQVDSYFTLVSSWFVLPCEMFSIKEYSIIHVQYQLKITHSTCIVA